MIGIKQIFTWWNKKTLGTFLKTLFFGKLVGNDEFGNYLKNNCKNSGININHSLNTKLGNTATYL